MSIFRPILACIAPMLLVGCENVFEKPGTTSIYTKCFNNTKEQGLKEKTAKLHCVNKHQQYVNTYLPGNGSYYNYDRPWFEATVTNKTPDYVITSFSVSINASDGVTVENKTFDNMWIEPGETITVSLYNEDLKYKPKADTNTQDKWWWGTDNIRGLKISQ